MIYFEKIFKIITKKFGIILVQSCYSNFWITFPINTALFVNGRHSFFMFYFLIQNQFTFHLIFRREELLRLDYKPLLREMSRWHGVLQWAKFPGQVGAGREYISLGVIRRFTFPFPSWLLSAAAKLFGSSHSIGWENVKQTIVTMEPSPKTIELHANKILWNERF